MKKIVRGLITVLIIIILVALVGTIYIEIQKRKFREEAELEMLAYEAQYYVNAYKVIDILEKNDIKIDESYKKDLADVSKKIVSGYYIEGYGIQMLAEIMFLNDAYDLGKSKQIQKIVDTYYIEDKKIFADCPVDVFLGNVDEYEELWISINLTIIKELSGTDLLNKYNLCEGIAMWYNENIGKKDADEDTLKSIFFALDKEDQLDLIDKDSILPILESDMTTDIEEVCSNSTMTDILSMKSVNRFHQIFYNDKKYENMTDIMLSKMSSEEELEYIKEDTYFVVFLEMMLEGVNEIDKNSFFAKNINRCLIDNYEATQKEE